MKYEIEKLNRKRKTDSSLSPAGSNNLDPWSGFWNETGTGVSPKLKSLNAKV
jgi:hypothetical protein